MNAIKQETWDKFTDKAKWDTIAALRGPDCRCSDVIKWFATSVIRGYLSGVMRVGGLVNKDLQLIIYPVGDLPRQNEPAHKHQWDYNHYFTHVREAAHWLGLPAVGVPVAIYLPLVDGSMYTLVTACEGFIKYFEEVNGKVAKIKADKSYDLFQAVLGGSTSVKQTHVDELKRHLTTLKAGAY